MPPKPSRKRTKPQHRLIARAMLVVIVIAVFAALWLFDTGALVHVIRAEIAAHPWASLALVGGFALALAVSAWRARRPRRRGKVSRKH